MGWGPVLIGVVLGCVGCGDDGVAMTEGASSGATSTGSGTPTEGTPTEPTTTESATTQSPTSTTSTTDVPTTDTTPTSTSTSSSTTGTDTDTTGDTSSDTDTTTTSDTETGGIELVGRSVSQTVNGGTVAKSANFRMVFTIGQPTQNQGTYKSDSFRLQGGLVGANGSPP